MPKPTPIQWFIILAVIAGVLALGLPPDPQALQQLHTTSTAYRLAVAVLLIPYVLIWYASFYAYAKLQEYSQPIKGTKDGNAFKVLTTGMAILSFSLVIPTIITLILNAIAVHNKSFDTAATIIGNYIPLFAGLISFLVLNNGARMLVRTTKNGTDKFDLRWHAPWFLLLSVIFTYITIENHAKSNPYHLPLWILLITIVVPYLYAWAMGLLSAYNLNIYANTVSGSLYRRAIKQFAGGIATAIVGSVAIQFVNATLANRFDDSLGAILLADYILLAVVAVGLVLIAIATKKLKLIEEV